MNIVGVSACVAGIAHTYLAKENLINAAKKRGHQIHIETQGVIGQEDKIPQEKIDSADVVILATDVKISGKERFNGLKIVEVPTTLAVKNADKIIERIETLLEEQKK